VREAKTGVLGGGLTKGEEGELSMGTVDKLAGGVGALG